jgi:hypothetical protein
MMKKLLEQALIANGDQQDRDCKVKWELAWHPDLDCEAGKSEGYSYDRLYLP